MTIVPERPPHHGLEERAADLVLARLHLRLGSLGLARAELEAMAGRHDLDDEGILDLAEARWRTGDLPGASEAATLYLESHPETGLALVIVAEAQANLGRPGEARRLAARALDANGGSIDPIFAGMPRSSIWPVDPGAAPESTGLFFDDPVMPAFGSETAIWGTGEPDGADGDGLAAALVGYDGPGLWDAHADTIAPALPNPTELLERARMALAAERPGQASAALALAIRAAPGLAPAILDLLAGRNEAVLALVRGDAHRIVGHEAEATRDYAMAVAAVGLERRSDDSERPPVAGARLDDSELRPEAVPQPEEEAFEDPDTLAPGYDRDEPPPWQIPDEPPPWQIPDEPPPGLGISEDP